MTRSISAPTLAAIAAQFTQPGYFVQIDWSSITRLTSRSSRSWNGQFWVGGFVEVRSVTWSADGTQDGTVILQNGTGAYGVVALDEGVADKRVQIWIFDAAATATGDPVKIFDGVGDSCDISPATVTVKLVSQRSGVLNSPRQYITRESGDTIVPASGTVITWGGQTYRLQRGRR